jgi:hypothetical protein
MSLRKTVNPRQSEAGVSLLQWLTLLAIVGVLVTVMVVNFV